MVPGGWSLAITPNDLGITHGMVRRRHGAIKPSAAGFARAGP
jgi:hypothetical protein